VADDLAENTNEKGLGWTVDQIICDPFSTNTTNCTGGLKGNIYYLTQAKIDDFKASSNKSVDYFYSQGVRLDATLFLKQLNVPTRLFDSGFPTSDNNYIKDENGNRLNEYFAFQLQSVLKLDSEPEGYYQIAFLSDDGTRLKYKNSPNDPTFTTLIDNDGDHSTQMGCSSTTLYLTKNSRLPIQVEYYQGPKYQIALVLLWRKVDTGTVANDPLCGKVGNDTFYGPSYTDFTNKYGYGQLVERGWKVLGETNFVAPE
jgi:hypothetical protein